MYRDFNTLIYSKRHMVAIFQRILINWCYEKWIISSCVFTATPAAIWIRSNEAAIKLHKVANIHV